MPRELDALPGCEVGENLFAGFSDLFFDLGDFFLETDAQGMSLGMFP